MTTLLTVIAVLAGIILLLLIVALFLPKDYFIEREILIDQPKAEVFDFITHLKNQELFSKWVMTDPNMNKTYKGADGTVGFVYAWEGNKKAGKGEQEIIDIVPGQRMDVEVRFEKPFPGLAYTPFSVTAATADQTIVKWGMRSKMNYPMNLMLGGIKKMLAKDMETSLLNLKRLLEEKKQTIQQAAV